jgi:WD40 repeat protein
MDESSGSQSLKERLDCGHRESVGLAWSPDGKLLVTGSGDNTVRVWDDATGTELLTLSGRLPG